MTSTAASLQSFSSNATARRHRLGRLRRTRRQQRSRDVEPAYRLVKLPGPLA